MLVAEWIERFKQDYLDKGKTPITWQSEYHKVLKHLPSDELLTPALLHELVRQSKPNTRTRIRYCMVTHRLAKFAGLDYDPTAYKGKYRPNHPRSVPDDRVIVDFWVSMKNPSWKWVVGMMATYGLRNHEVFRLDYAALKRGDRVVQVEQGKTGERQVWAFHPEWFERFSLGDVRLPNINMDRGNSALGHSVTEYLTGLKMPFAPYDLRHAYAIRTLSYGVDPSIAARYMGHSRDVHERIYRRWIDKARLQVEYDRVTGKVDRPRPPSA